MGLSLSIPFAMASDLVRQRVRLTPAMVVGALSVWLGFLIVSAAKPLRRRLAKLCPSVVGASPRVSALHRVTHAAEPAAEPA